MKKKASSSVDLHPIIAERWSPRSFDGTAEMSVPDLTALIEAARWAPSSNNSQPWRFVIARRGDHHFAQLVDTMAGFNKMWAPKAAALIFVLANTVNDDGSPRIAALYDAGLAASLLTVEAHHRGLAVHQIGGFDQEQAKSAFNIPANLTPIVILAVGKQAPAEELEDSTLLEREIADRVRKPLDELIIGGSL
jgi:nitroreductase